MQLSFEQFLSRVEHIPAPRDDSAREVLWLIPNVVGVGADKRGAREVFISGPQLVARSSTVQRHIEHQLWQGKHTPPFEANRLVLPLAEHFSSVAALIAFEFGRSLPTARTISNIQSSFSEIEPLIEMALRRSQLSEESVIGLLGELILLEQMLRSLPFQSENRSQILDMWRGYQRSSRDFCAGNVGIEVKTTSSSSSIHHIHGLAQVELLPTSGSPERQLFLFSVGLAMADVGELSVPVITDRILALLGPVGAAPMTPLQLRFVAALRAYGGESAAGYDHETMKAVPAYSARFTATFEPRLYDASDPSFRIVGRSLLQDTFVLPDEISYKIALPRQVTPFNPVAKWRDRIADIVVSALGKE